MCVLADRCRRDRGCRHDDVHHFLNRKLKFNEWEVLPKSKFQLSFANLYVKLARLTLLFSMHWQCHKETYTAIHFYFGTVQFSVNGKLVE